MTNRHGCPWTGETPDAETESDARTGYEPATLVGPQKEAAPAGNRGLTKDDARSRNG